MMTRLTATEMIDLLGLQELPEEGGLYTESYRSKEVLPCAALPARYGEARPMGSAIYYLLTGDPDCFSALHRLKSDEVYHFYLGDAVEMVMLLEGGMSRRIVLGPDLRNGQVVQCVVPAGVWQGSRLLAGGEYALLGTTMAPGYHTADFTLGRRAELLRQWPQAAQSILSLTRK